MTHVYNTEVDVNAFYFAGKEMKSFPRRISLGDRAVTFADGLRVQVQRAGQVMYFFDMYAADESTTYRLRQEGNQWTLVGTC